MSDQVNPQITDAVTQTNVNVVGEAPAMAMGSLYQTAAMASSVSLQNAVAAQQAQQMLSEAVANQGVMQIYSLDTVADAISVADMLKDE